MKRIVPLALAILMLTACGTAAPPPTLAPTEPPQTPAPEAYVPYSDVELVAGPEDEGYTFRSDRLGFYLPVPDEAAGSLGICEGIPGFDPEGDSYALYYLSPDTGEISGWISCIVVAPRREFFDPDSLHIRSYNALRSVVAASEEYIYMYMSSIGGSDLPPDNSLPGLEAAESVASLKGIVVDDPSGFPVLDPGKLSGAADALAGRGDAVLSRAEAVQTVLDLLTAENRGEEYPLRFTDVEPGSEAARSIAYLDSYGIFFGHEGSSFRLGEPITRAEFVQLLQRAQFAREFSTAYPYIYPYWFWEGGSTGVDSAASDVDDTHWAWDELCRAWYDGWLEVEDGLLRPDEPISAAEIAHIFRALEEEYAEGASTGGDAV